MRFTLLFVQHALFQNELVNVTTVTLLCYYYSNAMQLPPRFLQCSNGPFSAPFATDRS